MTILDPTELQYERTIIAAAKIGGWLIHSQRPAQNRTGRYTTPIKGHPGWPDLFMARGTHLLAIELKRHPRKPTPDQTAWLNALTAGGADARLTYVPEQLNELCQELANHAPRMDRP